MTVRRIMPDDPIAALSAVRIEIEPSADHPAMRTPEEQGAIREIAARLNCVAIGPKWLAEQERIAERILNKAVFDESDLVGHGPGSITYGITPHPVGSAPWYASRIAGQIGYLRRVLAGHTPDGITDDVNVWMVIDAAMQLGSAWTEAKINGMFGKPLATGLKQRSHLGENSKAANKKRQRCASVEHDRWQDEATAIWERRDLSVSACAAAVIKKLRLSVAVKTVADRIRHLDPKKLARLAKPRQSKQGSVVASHFIKQRGDLWNTPPPNRSV